MPVDIETELVQLWAGARAVASLLESQLAADSGKKTISTVGLRPGHDHQLAGLGQIMDLTQSYTLEIAIKALYKSLNSKSNPETTHDLLRLFESLPKDVKSRVSSKWQKASGLSSIARKITFGEFLEKYRLLFEESRYLFERDRCFARNSKDFDISMWVIADEIVRKQPDKTLLYNLYNVLSEERDGSLGEREGVMEPLRADCDL